MGKFGALISDAFKNKSCSNVVIPSLTWYDYFLNLFYQDGVTVNDPSNYNLVEMPQWPPVPPEEIKFLISQLKSGKASGPDLIPPELLKLNPEWWAKPLAALFTRVDSTSQMPPSGLNAIIVPIYKKGDPKSPANYRPISLLSVVGKLYARHLLNKLTAWMTESAVLGPEQVGFRQGKSTLDHCAVLTHLITKYNGRYGKKLYAAFLDLKGAFDSIPRDLLWDKLALMKVDDRLLYLLRKLYSQTSCQVRYTRLGNLTPKIITNKGVKQGCVLAPFLFNLFLNDLVPTLSSIYGHCPKLGQLHLPALLYADDSVLLSCSSIGLKRLLYGCLEYCKVNKLLLNYEKSKILVFSKAWKPQIWNIGGNMLEQVKHFKYLGLHFQYNSSWVTHRKYTINTAKNSARAVIRFFYTKGDQYVPAALRVFNAKSCSQLLYGIPIWINALNQDLEDMQSNFLRKILGVPNCVPYAALCLELNQMRLATKAWLITIKFWLHLLFSLETTSLTHLMLTENQSNWIEMVEYKIRTIGISLDTLYQASSRSAYRKIKRRILDIELQELTSAADKTCSPLSIGI